jgi:LDH2 family malate/lactate/ureidoglycolate dehydrogenase
VHGLPTTDAGAVLRTVKAGNGGGLVPLGGAGEETGGHKGYGLAVWSDIFSVLLSGGPLADTTQHPESGQARRMGNVCHFFGAWQVAAFRPLAEFKADMDGMLRRLKSSRKAEGRSRIYVAGEKEHEETERRLRDGIPLSEPVLADLLALSDELSVPPPTAGRRGPCPCHRNTAPRAEATQRGERSQRRNVTASHRRQAESRRDESR